jgi:hypothetical protein
MQTPKIKIWYISDQDYILWVPCTFTCTLHLLSIILRWGWCGTLPWDPPPHNVLVWFTGAKLLSLQWSIFLQSAINESRQLCRHSRVAGCPPGSTCWSGETTVPLSRVHCSLWWVASELTRSAFIRFEFLYCCCTSRVKVANELLLEVNKLIICIPSSSCGFFIPSTQRHYRRLILLLNTTYTATCFGRTTIFKEEIYYY